jgi:RsiW-degrading membrane proteinase PrsW (M82 family)
MYTQVILLLNGIYDIICFLCILFNLQNKIHFLHPNIFLNNHDKKFNRLLAFWIFTYGIVRLFAAFNSQLIIFASITYFIEAFYFLYELYLNETHKEKAIFVIIFSFILGIIICVMEYY